MNVDSDSIAASQIQRRFRWRMILALILVVGLSMTGVGDSLDNWHKRTSPTAFNLTAVAYGNDRFVAISESQGITLSSPDGVEWNQSVGPVRNRSFYGLAFGKGLFVAAGSVGRVITSPDGETWTLRDAGSSANLDSVAFLNNQFVIVGGSGAVLTSPDGIEWTPQASEPSHSWSGISFTNGTYVLVGTVTPSAKGIAGTSPDLIQFTVGNPISGLGLYCVTYGAGRFVAGGLGGRILSSPDGMHWNQTNTLGFQLYRDIRFADGRFITVGGDGNIWTSDAGTNWTKRFSGFFEPDLRGVAFGRGTYVAVGNSGGIYQSDPVGVLPTEISIVRMELVGNQVRLWFTGFLGQTYEIQRSPDMTGWVRRGDVLCNESPTEVAVPVDTGSEAFYRLVKP